MSSNSEKSFWFDFDLYWFDFMWYETCMIVRLGAVNPAMIVQILLKARVFWSQDQVFCCLKSVLLMPITFKEQYGVQHKTSLPFRIHELSRTFSGRSQKFLISDQTSSSFVSKSNQHLKQIQNQIKQNRSSKNHFDSIWFWFDCLMVQIWLFDHIPKLHSNRHQL